MVARPQPRTSDIQDRLGNGPGRKRPAFCMASIRNIIAIRFLSLPSSPRLTLNEMMATKYSRTLIVSATCSSVIPFVSEFFNKKKGELQIRKESRLPTTGSLDCLDTKVHQTRLTYCGPNIFARESVSPASFQPNLKLSGSIAPSHSLQRRITLSFS